ncbi:MAG: TolC family protein [Paludibacter sp.]|jgi:outer membrane protein TolC|nr:TolC family protein [Paludibacter sp.]
MKIKLSVPILLFCCINVFSQQSIDLQTCIETGLERNFDIKIIRNTQQISDNNHSVGNAGMLPTLDLNASYSGTNNNIDQFPANGNDKISNSGVNNSGFDLGISLNWTIFDGFQMFANYSRLAELKKIGELNTRFEIENFVSNLAAEYYNLVQQYNRERNLRSAVRLSKERLRIVEARYNIGSMSRLDLQQAKVDFKADSSKLIKQQENLFTSQVKINQLLANDVPTRRISPVDTVIVFNSLLDRDQLWNQVEQKNSIISLAKSEQNISIIDLQKAQSKNYPYIRLSAGYGYSADKYGLSTLNRQNSLGMNYGLTLGFNLFDGLNKIREQRNAKLSIENKNLQFQQLVLSLKSDFSNMWMSYHNNLGLVMLEEESLENAHENYDIAIERYKLGDLSGIELREAQNSLLEAEERLIQAQYDTKLCEISLLQISGNVSQLFKTAQKF